MVSFASKLRQVVAANFVEISRPGTPDGKETPKPEEAVLPDSPVEEQSPNDEISFAAPSTAPISYSDASSVAPDGVGTADSDATAPRASEEASETALTAAAGLSPEVVVSAPAAPESLRSDPMAVLTNEGAVDFGQVFVRAEVPSSASFTAEQALSMLHSMPSDLPLRIKRLTVKATLDAVGQAVGATPMDIVDDARRKIDALEEFIRDTAQRALDLRNAEDAEIARLRVVIAEREAAKVAVSEQEESMFHSCREKMTELDQVIAFFTTGETEAAASQAAEESDDDETDELPAYLQEDAVKRLLGLHGGDTETADEPDAVGAKSRSSGVHR